MHELNLNWIRAQVKSNRYILALHADEERRNDRLEIADVEFVLLNGKIIEEYPEDKRGCSCLVFGEARGRPVHVVCGKNDSGWLVIITVYIPSLPKWITPVKRRT